MGLTEGEVSKGANFAFDDCGHSKCGKICSHKHLISACACDSQIRYHSQHVLKVPVGVFAFPSHPLSFQLGSFIFMLYIRSYLFHLWFSTHYYFHLEQEHLKKAKVGPLPGVTQHISGFKVPAEFYSLVTSCVHIRLKSNLMMLRVLCGFSQIGEKPSVYVLDTPGVLVPNIDNIDTGLKLALTGNFSCDSFVKCGVITQQYRSLQVASHGELFQ